MDLNTILLTALANAKDAPSQGLDIDFAGAAEFEKQRRLTELHNRLVDAEVELASTPYGSKRYAVEAKVTALKKALKRAKDL
jgi:hypothetical protein